MTRLELVGFVPVWAGATAAVLLGIAVWWVYRRERASIPGQLRWLLPLLRGLAVVLTVLVLTGPILRHRKEIGQLGRVFIFVDGSRSMTVTDRQMPIPRQLLIAQQQGWTPRDDAALWMWDSAMQLADARRAVELNVARSAASSAPIATDVAHLATVATATADRVDRFLKTDSSATYLTSGDHDLAGVSKTLRDDVTAALQRSQHDSSPIDIGAGGAGSPLTPICRAAKTCEDALLALYAQMDVSSADGAATSRVTARQACATHSRWQRATQSLCGRNQEMLRKLAEKHHVSLNVMTPEQMRTLWDSGDSMAPPPDLGPSPTAAATDLAAGLAKRLHDASSASATGPAQDGRRTAVVLLTDGQHNRGASPIPLAQQLSLRGIPVFAVGYGCRTEPPDLAVLRVEHPDKVFQRDRVRGTIKVKDRMPIGQPLLLQIQHRGVQVWQQRLTTDGSGMRDIAFDFPIDAIVEQRSNQMEPGVRYHAIALSFDAAITPLEDETDNSNNIAQFRLMAITQNHKLLLIDGRPRWETRYLRNIFQRDKQWHVDTIIAGPGTENESLPRGSGTNQFPTDEDRLFDYDLIVLGEVAQGVLNDRDQQWLRDFVEKRGGGIVLMDGQRRLLRGFDNPTLGPLLPISWRARPLAAPIEHLQLSSRGSQINALILDWPATANQDLWRHLPAPHRLAPVEALPDAEVVVEARAAQETVPVIVTRSFGAGHVLYLAMDETWRWRYKLADTIHQRFWHQIVKWIMSSPFTVSNEYMALDSGPPSYTSGQQATIRVKLRDAGGQPMTQATVDALLWRQGEVVATIALQRDNVGNGLYRGQTGPLAEGSYEVTIRAAGLNRNALNCKTQFIVLPRPNSEMQHLACNDELLATLASDAGGMFLREEAIDRLPQLLAPFSSGRVIESETVLWQSYWWFATIVGILAIEWILRKRAGLL